MTQVSNNDIAKAIYLVSKGKSGSELKEAHKKVINFLMRKNLLSKSKDILHRLSEIINKEEGIMSVKVWSAERLKEEFKHEVKAFLKKYYKVKEVLLTEMIDEKLIGGVKIESEDEVIDLTVKNKIKKLQEHLTRKI